MASLEDSLRSMGRIYHDDPNTAVRGQGFIQTFHGYLEEELDRYLTDAARRRGVRVVREAHLYGSFKAKDEDLAVIDPMNGPLVTIGVRSQMSSVGKNALTYYQDIIGECISLQQRFPMAVMGYVYLHPYRELKPNKNGVRAVPDHKRWARLYASIAQRDDRLYRSQVGSYDQFAYLVVDFDDPACMVRDDIVRSASPDVDLDILTFLPRLMATFAKRNAWLDDIFEQPSD